MKTAFRKQEECTRDVMLNDFLAYRKWYGLVPPEHERSIELGDLGRFSREGEFIRLGRMFSTSEKTVLKNGYAVEKFIGIQRPSSANIKWSEELVFDPFVSGATGWTQVADEKLGEYIPPV